MDTKSDKPPAANVAKTKLKNILSSYNYETESSSDVVSTHVHVQLDRSYMRFDTTCILMQ